VQYENPKRGLWSQSKIDTKIRNIFKVNKKARREEEAVREER